MKYYKQLLNLIILVATGAGLLFLNACGNDEDPKANLGGPSAPTLTSPTDGSENQSLTPTLSWEAAQAESGIKDYAVYFDTNTDPTTLVATGKETTLTFTTSLAYTTTYYWKVQVTDNNDQIATSEIFSFATVGETGFEIGDVEFGMVLEAQGYATVEDDIYILDMTAAAKATILDLGGASAAPLDIKDIDGIQFFSALRNLDLDYTSVSQLDLSNNTNLDTLQYTNGAENTANFLTSLTLPAGVVRVRVFRHNLSDFDASGFADLEYLRLDGDNIPNTAVGGVTNVLASLTVNETANHKLVHLDMGGNLNADGNAITYEVSQGFFDQLTSTSGGNKDGVVLPATFSITAVDPLNDATDVVIDNNIMVTFSSEVESSSVMYTLTDVNSNAVVSTSSANGAVMTIDPDSDLANETLYTLTITAATGVNGASISENFTAGFTTIAASAIVVSSIVPADQATGIALGVNIIVTFSSDLNASSVMYTFSDSDDNAVATSSSVSGAVLTIDPNADLSNQKVYNLTITAAEGTNGGSLAENFVSGFTTVAALQIQGVMSFQAGGTAAAGRDRAIHLRANQNIADLSIYGIGIANNGGGSDGKELTLPAMSVSAGDDILFIRGEDEATITTYFGSCFSGFDVTFTDANAGGAINFDGNDGVELYENDVVIEVYGNVVDSGTGLPWEYTGTWGYRQADGTFATGAIDCTLNAADNASSTCPYPFCP